MIWGEEEQLGKQEKSVALLLNILRSRFCLLYSGDCKYDDCVWCLRKSRKVLCLRGKVIRGGP